jgi:recombination protein RecR
LAEAISDVKTNIHQCRICYNLAESETCSICADTHRDHGIICVVEQPKDVISLEKTGLCRWVYHVLNGHIAPLEGVEPDDLTIDALVKTHSRPAASPKCVMATNPNLEGDGTSFTPSFCAIRMSKSTRLARGLPTGSCIEFSAATILQDAILGRTAF